MSTNDDWTLSPESAAPSGPTTRSSRTERWHRRAAERLAQMHLRYGKGPVGQTCRDCAFLVVVKYANRYLKCQKAGISSSDATDWRAKWAACGAYQKAED